MLRFLLEKEFKQLLRNAFIPRLILFMPVMILLVLPWAANQEIRDLRLSVVDNDHSTFSGRLIRKAVASGYFRLADVSASDEEALQAVESGKADIILNIEPGFETNLVREGAAKVMVSANAVNSMKGGLGSYYLSSILNDYAVELRKEAGLQAGGKIAPVITLASQGRFNPHLDYKVFMIPALVVMLLTILGGFLPALNIVGEKETGTIEQINVTPVNKFVFILAKLIPYWVTGFVVLTICILIAAGGYGLVPKGNLAVLYLFAAIYVLSVSGLGLVISNHSNTLQQAMFVMWFFTLIFVLMSGLFTPITSMPDWAQAITAINPLRYFVEVMRMIYLKGSSLSDLLPHLLVLAAFALFCSLWAVLSYRKNS
ncbi:ABC transporter permease [Parabacteroides sp. Marseille-P3160]|uniref:ABC transporter permease n=1 Tax=Parabacteroides sp. Marseille-P3160 TaxID=1917887 RepID=UPI0009BBEE1F|nr:ABC transporter permease [Parabacteroides sp. Marseille-P3160]